MLMTTLALTAFAFAAGDGGVTWFDGSHTTAIEAAAKENKPLLTYFWANTENCSRLYNETMSNPLVVAEMSDMVCFSANAGDDQGRKLLEKYKLNTVPAMLVIGADGEAEEMLVGFIDASTFVFEMQRIKRGENTISDLRRKVAGEHEDLEGELAQRKMLAEKLGFVGDESGAEEMLQSIFDRDKKGTTVVGALAHTDRIIGEISESGGEDLSTWNLKPLAKFVKRIPNPEAKFEGRLVLAGLELESGNQNDGVSTYMQAWKDRPEVESALNSGFTIVDRIAYLGDELTNRQREFALLVATDVVTLIDERASRPCEACGKNGGEASAEVVSDDGEDMGDGGECGCEENDGLRPYALYQVARCQQLSGDEAAALSTMESVVTLVPDNETYVAFRDSLADTNS